MSVDTSGRGEHRGLGFKTDDPETSHGAALGAGLGQSEQVGLDRGGAAAECVGVHVRMAPGVDMADQPGLWPGLDLEQKTLDRNGGDGLRLVAARQAGRGGPVMA